MTTSYHKREQAKPEGPVKPVAVRSQSTEPKKPRKCVSVIVERTGLCWWFLRGVSMGGGFALVWYGLRAVI